MKRVFNELVCISVTKNGRSDCKRASHYEVVVTLVDIMSIIGELMSRGKNWVSNKDYICKWYDYEKIVQKIFGITEF